MKGDLTVSNEKTATSGKMGLFSSVCMAIGCIIGAGIFATIPSAAEIAGTGIIWAYVVALFAMIFRYLPTIYNGSVLPTPSGNYMHTTRLVGANVGFLQVTAIFNNVFLLASFATTFASYFSTYVPGVNTKVLAIGSLVVFTFITCMGVSTTKNVQNVLTCMLLAALGMFVFFGAPHVSSEYITLTDVVAPKGLTVTTLGATVALLSSSLVGGHACMNYASDLKNPSRDVVLSFLISTVFCGVFFMIISYVAIGAMPISEFASLKDEAQQFMPAAVYHYFIICGACFAILTSMNGNMLSASKAIGTIADDKVLPEWFSKPNSRGAYYNTTIFLGVCAAIVVLFGLSIGTLMSAYSLLTLLTGLILFVPALRVKKLYPKMYEKAYLKMSDTKLYILCALGIAVSLWQLYSLFATMQVSVLMTLMIWLACWYIYFFIRKSYLKKKNVDLNELMRRPYKTWEV